MQSADQISTVSPSRDPEDPGATRRHRHDDTSDQGCLVDADCVANAAAVLHGLTIAAHRLADKSGWHAIAMTALLAVIEERVAALSSECECVENTLVLLRDSRRRSGGAPVLDLAGADPEWQIGAADRANELHDLVSTTVHLVNELSHLTAGLPTLIGVLREKAGALERACDRNWQEITALRRNKEGAA
jgi:hypothetical protein